MKNQAILFLASILVASGLTACQTSPQNRQLARRENQVEQKAEQQKENIEKQAEAQKEKIEKQADAKKDAIEKQVDKQKADIDKQKKTDEDNKND